MICPECKAPATQTVNVEVTLSAGDDSAGSSSSARLQLCGACGQRLLVHFVQLATNVQLERGAGGTP